MTPTAVSIRPSPALAPCLCAHRPVDVRAWRLCWLLDAGFETDLAEQLAASPGVDLHAILELVDHGCPPELAARILAPITVDGGAP